MIPWTNLPGREDGKMVQIKQQGYEDLQNFSD